MAKLTHDQALQRAAEDHKRFTEALSRGDYDAAQRAAQDTVDMIRSGVITESEGERA